MEYITTAENNCGEHECMEVKDFVISLLPNVFRGNISFGNLGRASAGQLSAFIATSIYLVAVGAPQWQSGETNNRFNLCILSLNG